MRGKDATKHKTPLIAIGSAPPEARMRIHDGRHGHGRRQKHLMRQESDMRRLPRPGSTCKDSTCGALRATGNYQGNIDSLASTADRTF